MDNNQTTCWSMTKRFDIVKPHVALLCVPGFECVILRADCLARRSPLKSKSDRTVPRVELQIQRQLVRTRTVRSRSNVHPKNVRVLPFRSASANAKFNIVVVNDNIFEFVCPFSRFRTEAPTTRVACENRTDNLFQRLAAKVVSSTRVAVSQGKSLNELVVTVESAPT